MHFSLTHSGSLLKQESFLNSPQSVSEVKLTGVEGINSDAINQSSTNHKRAVSASRTGRSKQEGLTHGL